MILSDKTVLTPEQVTWWFGGATGQIDFFHCVGHVQREIDHDGVNLLAGQNLHICGGEILDAAVVLDVQQVAYTDAGAGDLVVRRRHGGGTVP